MITKATFVVRSPVARRRFVEVHGFTKAHVTHPELKATFQLEILGVKKNPNGPMYSSLGVLTKGTIIEVSGAGNAAAAGKSSGANDRCPRSTNNPENDGCRQLRAPRVSTSRKSSRPPHVVHCTFTNERRTPPLSPGPACAVCQKTQKQTISC